MKKIDYLKLVFSDKQRQEKIYEDRKWYIDVFAYSQVNDLDDESIQKLKPYSIVRKPDAYYFVSDKREVVDNVEKNILVKIDDAPRQNPIFSINEKITIDKSLVSNIKEPIETMLGNVIINAIAIEPVFNNKVQFIDGKIDTSILEKNIVPKIYKLEGQPPQGYITLDEFLEFVDRISFFSNLADLFVLPSTEKSITVSPDFHKKKEEILKKYKDKLTDPVEVINLEKELMELDKEYIKNEPTYGKMLSGKSLNVARKKMFIMYGDEREFKEKKQASPIVKSLEEGWDTSEQSYTSYINALRTGSYARGAETVKGGVVSKTLLRTLGSMSIQDEPCDTKTGIMRSVTQSNYTKFTNRYIKIKNNWVLIENDEEAKKLIGQDVEVRSAMYCKAPGYHICYKCLNETLKGDKNGITTLSLEISNVILYMFMGLMHGVALSNAEIEFGDLCT